MPHTSACNGPPENTVASVLRDKREGVRKTCVEGNRADPIFLKKNKKKKESCCVSLGEDVFLYTSYSLVVVELAAAFFTLSVIHFNISQNTIHKVTLGYYSLYCVLVSILIVDSLIALKKSYDERAQKKISSKEYLIKKIKEIGTVVSSVFWIALSIGSIVMELSSQTPPFSLLMFTLFLSIAAPAIGAFSAATRAHEVVYSSRQEVKRIAKVEDRVKKGDASEEDLEKLKSQQARKPRTGRSLYLRSALFLVIAAFEFAHCLCHFVEAYYLVGETHHLFYITDKMLLGTQATLALLFLVLEVLEKYFEKKSVVATPEISPVATPELRSIDETDSTQKSCACLQIDEVTSMPPVAQRVVA